MELLLMLDAARGASAAQITAVIPHYAYARSDKKDASRISIGGRLVADLLITAGARRVITMALHAPAGARLLRRAGRSPHRDRRARRPLPRPRPRQRRRRLAGPRQRQDRDPVRPAARRAGGGRAASSASPTTGSSSRRSSATSPAGGRSCSTTRSPPAARSSSCSTSCEDAGVPGDLGRVHARAVRRQGRRAAARTTRDHRGRHDRHRAAADRRRGPSSRSARWRALFAEAIHRSHIGESVSSLFDGVDPAYAPPQQRLPFDDPM